MKRCLLSVLILSVFVGCLPKSFVPLEDRIPEDAVKQGLQNLVGTTSYNFDLLLMGVFDALKGDKPVKISIDGKLEGQIDAKDFNDPKIRLSVSGYGSIDHDESQNIVGDLIINKSNLYFNVSSLPDLNIESFPRELIEQFIGKWFEVPVQSSTYVKNNPMFFLSSADKKEIKRQKRVFEDYDFFTDVKFEGEELVKGENSFKYGARFNKDAFRDYAIYNREYLEDPMTEQEISELENTLNTLTFSGYVYVSEVSKKVNRISGDLYVKDVSDKQVKEGDFEVIFTMWDFNEPVSLRLPTDFQVFNPFMLLRPESSEAR